MDNVLYDRRNHLADTDENSWFWNLEPTQK